MVTTCELRKPEYSTYIVSQKNLIVPPTQHAYSSRSCKINDKAILRYLNILNNIYKNTEDQPTKDLLLSHRENVSFLMSEVLNNNIGWRYADMFPGVEYDSIAVLESIGGTASAKHYQVLYSLSTRMPELLAFICEEDGEEFKAKLEANCKEQGVSMLNLSRALCNIEYPLMNTTCMDPLVGISPRLDAFMSDILNHPELCKVDVGNGCIDLTSKEYTLEDRLSTLISYQLVCLEQYIFNFIIKDWCDNPLDGILLTSKGLSSLTFQSPLFPTMQTISIKLGDSKPFDLIPRVLSKGDYLVALQEGWT